MSSDVRAPTAPTGGTIPDGADPYTGGKEVVDVGGRIVDEITIGASDIDCTVDPHGTGAKLGPIRAFQVLAGSGSLVYVDDLRGVVRTLTNLSSSSDPIDPIAIRTIHGTGSGTPSAALTLRVRW